MGIHSDANTRAFAPKLLQSREPTRPAAPPSSNTLPISITNLHPHQQHLSSQPCTHIAGFRGIHVTKSMRDDPTRVGQKKIDSKRSGRTPLCKQATVQQRNSVTKRRGMRLTALRMNRLMRCDVLRSRLPTVNGALSGSRLNPNHQHRVPQDSLMPTDSSTDPPMLPADQGYQRNHNTYHVSREHSTARSQFPRQHEGAYSFILQLPLASMVPNLIETLNRRIPRSIQQSASSNHRAKGTELSHCSTSLPWQAQAARCNGFTSKSLQRPPRHYAATVRRRSIPDRTVSLTTTSTSSNQLR